jgi:hypothetical protein
MEGGFGGDKDACALNGCITRPPSRLERKETDFHPVADFRCEMAETPAVVPSDDDVPDLVLATFPNGHVKVNIPGSDQLSVRRECHVLDLLSMR